MHLIVLVILEYFSPLWRSGADRHLQLLERQVHSVETHCHDQGFLSLSRRRYVVVGFKEDVFCGAGVFGHIEFKLLSPSLELPT